MKKIIIAAIALLVLVGCKTSEYEVPKTTGLYYYDNQLVTSTNLTERLNKGINYIRKAGYEVDIINVKHGLIGNYEITLFSNLHSSYTNSASVGKK